VLTAAAKDKATKAAAQRAADVVGAVNLARDLVNTPPSDLPPAQLAPRALTAVEGLQVETTVLDEKALRKGAYGGILGVGQGSANPPRLVRLAYRPRGAKRHLALVGKGITFDSGGLSLKPAQGMEWMKSDMGGAAAVVAAIAAIARLGLRVDVTAWAPMAENMPSGAAQRPSDVLTVYGGKTVEVLNTDAEGRLILADALVAASGEAPDLIVDVATLTGRSSSRSAAVPARSCPTTTPSVRACTPRRARPASRCGRCRCPTSCGRRWTPRSRTSRTWATSSAACSSPDSSSASSSATAFRGRT
jgi:leucyl aminopeptidase